MKRKLKLEEIEMIRKKHLEEIFNDDYFLIITNRIISSMIEKKDSKNLLKDLEKVIGHLLNTEVIDKYDVYMYVDEVMELTRKKKKC